jgi:hypothetical protein
VFLLCWLPVWRICEVEQERLMDKSFSNVLTRQKTMSD